MKPKLQIRITVKAVQNLGITSHDLLKGLGHVEKYFIDISKSRVFKLVRT